MSDGHMDHRCACGAPALHTLGMQAFFCCACWVALGMPPSAWHPECVRASEEQA